MSNYIKILNEEITKINEFSEDLYYRFKDLIQNEKDEFYISEVSEEKRLIIDTLEKNTDMSLKYLKHLRLSLENFIQFIENGEKRNE